MPYLKGHSTRRVPQWAPIPGSRQVPNSAGGFAWEVDDWARHRRFLILGSDGGSYYAAEWTLTRENAQAVERCIRGDGERAVAEVVRVSEEGRAPKNDPALFALAMAAGLGDAITRRAALDALPRVARTGTQLFEFATFVEQFRGWGRSLRRAVGGWYASRSVDALAYQAVKYRQRDGVTHRDLLRLAHPAAKVSAGNPTLAVSPEHEALFEWIARGTLADGLPRLVEGFTRAQAADTPRETAVLVREYGLPREALKPEHLTSIEVWAALLEDMPMTALIRSLATMTRVGVIATGSDGAATVAARLGDRERIGKARVHPIAILAALRTYGAGRGARGRGEWNPVREVVDALDAAFYAAFENVEPTGKRLLLALDVSGSMTWGQVAGIPGLTPRDASAALALVTAATETTYEIVGFFCGKAAFKKTGRQVHAGYTDGLTPLNISPRQRLDDAVKTVSNLPFGGTDCALPMLYAQALEMEIDTFLIYTDSETWAGAVHPVQALGDYRPASGIDARLVVVGMVSNGFSIADPADGRMLDVVGFDTATPQLIADFARRGL
ncbi:MAG TPA: TROVE domain-containing protein [Solirubrobacteraceae bacterium]|nr:TROVE domain-containing protein [Solirubrobacteraceae bacterium]